MKVFKFFSIAAIAALLLAPTAAMAKTNISFSLNLFDCLAPRMVPAPVIVAPPAPPVYYYYPVPHCQPRTIVKEYHYYHHHVPQCQVEEINPSAPDYYYNNPHPR